MALNSEIIALRPKLIRYSYSLIENSEEAQDIVQNCYLKLHLMNGELDKIQNIEAYAMRIVRNESLNFIKKNKKENRNFTDFQQTDSIDAERILESKENIHRLEKCIETLSEKQKEVFYLREMEGLEFKEIAKRLQMTEETVRANLSRARKQIFNLYLSNKE